MADKTAEQRSMPVEDDTNIAASQLSAIVDDELEDREVDLILRRLSRDLDSRTRWERYHLISDALQGHLPDAFDAGFAARVRQAVEAESPLRPAAKPLPTWYKPVTGFGLAASVVLVALFGFKLTRTDNAFPSSGQLASTVFSAPIAIQTASTAWQPDRSDNPAEARLNSYLVNHNGAASRNSVNGMLPYVRMVGYQTNR
ncbi:MAG TPA: sigma-E factor negative regulatory protein [Candidatus Competibacter sp.]|nr:sigma-E factor negative regulatory protein [Candidatus Competibacter sp.]